MKAKAGQEKKLLCFPCLKKGRKVYMERELGCILVCPKCKHKITFGVGVY